VQSDVLISAVFLHDLVFDRVQFLADLGKLGVPVLGPPHESGICTSQPYRPSLSPGLAWRSFACFLSPGRVPAYPACSRVAEDPVVVRLDPFNFAATCKPGMFQR
jgi:hypothetical protein